MIAELLIYKILQLFTIMIIGFIAAKTKIITREGSLVLSKITLFLLMPSAIINSFDFGLTETVKNGLLYSLLAAVIIHIILLLLDKLYGRFISKNAAERASVMYSNAGNLIIPIVSFVMGEEWVVFSLTFMSVQLLLIWSHGARLFNHNEKFDIKKVVFNVNIIAIFIGFILMISGLRLPSFVKDITSSFGSMVGSVAMLIAGVLAASIDFKKALKEIRLYRVIIFRLIVYPLIMLAVLKLLSLYSVIDGDKILLISFLASITPAAATVMQFSQINNSDVEFATTVHIVGTIFCILTMPLLVMAFGLI